VSPSPSTSAANTESAPSAPVEIVRSGEVLAAVVLVPRDLVVNVRRAEHVHVAVAVHVRRKRGLGPKLAAVEIVRAVKFWLPSFSYQAILWS
jgi:hypothetical protein